MARAFSLGEPARVLQRSQGRIGQWLVIEVISLVVGFRIGPVALVIPRVVGLLVIRLELLRLSLLFLFLLVLGLMLLIVIASVLMVTIVLVLVRLLMVLVVQV